MFRISITPSAACACLASLSLRLGRPFQARFTFYVCSADTAGVLRLMIHVFVLSSKKDRVTVACRARRAASRFRDRRVSVDALRFTVMLISDRASFGLYFQRFSALCAKKS